MVAGEAGSGDARLSRDHGGPGRGVGRGAWRSQHGLRDCTSAHTPSCTRIASWRWDRASSSLKHVAEALQEPSPVGPSLPGQETGLQPVSTSSLEAMACEN